MLNLSPSPFESCVFVETHAQQLSVGLAHASDHADASGEGLEAGGGLSLFGVVFDMGGVYAALLQGACVLVVVGGLEASKYTVNIFCLAKVGGYPRRLQAVRTPQLTTPLRPAMWAMAGPPPLSHHTMSISQGPFCASVRSCGNKERPDHGWSCIIAL